MTVATDALRTFERARLQELEGVVERGRDTFIEVGNALREIRDRHLHRGTHASFEEYVRDRWSWSRSRAYQLIDAAAVAAAMSTTVDTPTPLNEAQARELAPLLRDQGEQAVVAAYRDLRERYGDQVTAPLIRRAVGGRLAHDERMRAAAARREAASVCEALPADVELRHGDFREVLSDIPDGSVDLVFTDPPYPAEYLDLWRPLGLFAARVLKPGAVLVTYSGQLHLPEVLASLLAASDLEWVWMDELLTPGPHTMVHAARRRSGWKPLLVLARRPRDRRREAWLDDTVISEARVKDEHLWQQSIGPARHYIEALTKPGDLIVDPFVGSGTTAVAAYTLGRHVIGADVDASAIATAKRRVAATATDDASAA